MPSRVDIRRIELGAELLPHVALTEILDIRGRLRFRFRLSGTAPNEGAGLELTGHFIDELNPIRSTADMSKASPTR